jgi:hypothetical protein
MSYRTLQHELLMATKHPDEVTRVLKELDEAVNETARLQEASGGTPQAAPISPEDDRRRNQRRGVVDERRTGDRREGASDSDA